MAIKSFKYRIKVSQAISIGSSINVVPIYIPQKKVGFFWINVLDLNIPRSDRPKTLRNGFLNDIEKAKKIIHTLSGSNYDIPLFIPSIFGF